MLFYMKTTFYIVATLNTPDGPEAYARFELGNKRQEALDIFRQLKGSADMATGNFLSMELMETVEGLPVNLLLISCTLDELAANCRTISKELFNMMNLNGKWKASGDDDFQQPGIL